MNGQAMDLKQHKKELRKQFRALRGAITPQDRLLWDKAIAEQVLALPEYKSCQTLLGFVPLPGEVDTLPILQDAWRTGKKVAVPRCVPNSRVIEFYLIDSLSQLSEGAYNVREPDPARCEQLTDFSGGPCLVPGLSYDRGGYRLGYGGGYYDVFLSGPFRGGISVGLCYSVCTTDELAVEELDRPCRWLVTNEGARCFDGAIHR